MHDVKEGKKRQVYKYAIQTGPGSSKYMPSSSVTERFG